MRELLIFALVFALTSTANAVLSLYVDGSPVPPSVELLTGEGFTIQVHSSTASWWYAYLVIEDGGVGLLYEPSSSYGDRVGIPQLPSTYWYLSPPVILEDPQAGIQWDIVYESADQGSATVSLYDAEVGYAMVDSIDITVVPEPMTLVLLGAGGLALLRKRRP
jgi:hypothetical protein